MTNQRKAEQKQTKNIDIAKEINVMRIHRLSTTIVNLVDLKVKGIITDTEYQQKNVDYLAFKYYGDC